MNNIVRARLLSFLAALVIVPIGTVMAVLFAKGYRADLQKRQITVSGIFAARSFPENAQIFLDGKYASSITNSNLNLPPGEYLVELKKEGYVTWKKFLVIEKEVVTSVTAFLFPLVPTLRSINDQPATRVTIAPDGTKVIYLSKANQIYHLDLTESPLGTINRNARLIGSLPAGLSKPDLQMTWSPDSRQLLITDPKNRIASNSAFLVDPTNQLITPAVGSQTYLLKSWADRKTVLESQKFNSLPADLKPILATASADLSWSPKENRIMYTATASATLPSHIQKPLPGSSTQFQTRELVPNQVYVYDLEEDRNFKIDEVIPVPTPKPAKSKTVNSSAQAPNNGWLWFPTSAHLYRIDNNQITIIEHDGQNRTVVYTGPLFENTAIPYPSGKLMLLLTRFETTPPASTSAEPKLYTLTLR